MTKFNPSLSRRSLINSMAALAGASALPMPAWAKGQMGGNIRRGMDELAGPEVNLHIGEGMFKTGSRAGHAIAGQRHGAGPITPPA